MLLRLYLVATTLLLLLLGARRHRLSAGEVSLVYYTMGPRKGRRPSAGSEGSKGSEGSEGAKGSEGGEGSEGTEGAGDAAGNKGAEGTVETWVMLHGLGGVAATWGPTLLALARGCRVVVPELSALGGTAAPGGGLSVRRGVAVVTRLIELEGGGKPVTLAGLSLGGWIAVRIALARPELVSRLVLIDAGGWRDQDWERIQSLITIADLDGVDRLYPALFGTAPWIMRRSRPGFLRSFTSPGVRTVLRETRERDTYTGRDLARLTMPAALVWGEHDGLFTLETARAMAAALPGSRLYVLPGCGHAVHMECPRALAATLQRVRREVPNPGGRDGEP
jgi:pimeloyl-ACP methyl ester carboxylesterase